ncbi:MAG: hypothetical protein A2W26_11325 [Acidobacteria bacterium RBG_16_64_8]|nr:MAG: hypothetical protein A2W26_11325 [Acidobacteria bacterium RBG_16_64_8]
MSAQVALAALLSDRDRFEADVTDRSLLADCLLDFLAAVLTGVRGELGRSVIRSQGVDGVRCLAFSMSYLAEISEFSHGHNRSAGHVGSTTLPVALAFAARRGGDDARTTRAVLAGYEAFSRVGSSMMPGLARWGSVSTGFVGSLGAAATAAFLLDTDAAAVCSALGVAACTTPLSPVEAREAGGNALEAAVATSTGILAAELAAGGFRGPSDLLDHLHRRIVGSLPAPAFAAEDTARLAIHDVYFKPYPCCRFTHGAIQGILEILGSGVASDQIERIDVRVPPRALSVCHNLPAFPTTVLERQFSLRYLCALAALIGDVAVGDVMHPLPDRDEAVVAFAGARVSQAAEDRLVHLGNICPASIVVQTVDGRQMERTVVRPWGCPEAPLTRQDVLEKFRRAAGPVLARSRVDDWQALALELTWSDLAVQVGDVVSAIGR